MSRQVVIISCNRRRKSGVALSIQIVFFPQRLVSQVQQRLVSQVQQRLVSQVQQRLVGQDQHPLILGNRFGFFLFFNNHYSN
jgi:hypothetical protein